jgi:carboxymethylenebutenolidase
MVKEPYVNSVPTMAGGVGYEGVKYFYQNHFIFKNPKDTKTILMSRTIGIDRVVDEILFCFTHDREIDWLLPNIAPTGKYIEIAIVAVINLRGDKLYSEHIYWDQASVLVQAGLLDPKKLPVGGVEVSHKTYNKEIASNPMIST